MCPSKYFLTLLSNPLQASGISSHGKKLLIYFHKRLVFFSIQLAPRLSPPMHAFPRSPPRLGFCIPWRQTLRGSLVLPRANIPWVKEKIPLSRTSISDLSEFGCLNSSFCIKICQKTQWLQLKSNEVMAFCCHVEGSGWLNFQGSYFLLELIILIIRT